MKTKFLPSLFCLFITFIGIALLNANDVFTPENYTAFTRGLKDKLENQIKIAPEERLYLQTDKTFYSPGETIWFNLFVRDGFDLNPSKMSEIAHVDVINPSGTVDKTFNLICKNGRAAADLSLDQNIPGGIYTLKAYTTYNSNEEPALVYERKIQIQDIILPDIKMNIEFEKKSYGEGDEVKAFFEAEDKENNKLVNHPFTYNLNIGGESKNSIAATTDNEGKAEIRFTLPNHIKKADGILNISIENQGLTESISRSVPIVLNKINISFFPEGGDLAAGLNSNIAFKAVNEFGKPADVEGYITDGSGNKITSFTSYHNGMGAFAMTPELDETYTAHISKPTGVKETWTLPETVENGISMNVNSENSDRLEIQLKSNDDQQVQVVAMVRSKIMYAATCDIVNGSGQIIIPVNSMPMGVCQLTVIDQNNIAVAERLALINLNKKLNISVKTDKEFYKPGENVNATLKVTDHNNQPVRGQFTLSATNDILLSYADDKQGNILSALLLEQDIKEKIEEPAFYLSGKPKSAKALDYLLMCSGWRRFTWEKLSNNTKPVVNINPEKTIFAGRIIHAYTGLPIPDVNMLINGKAIIKSDEKGKFSSHKVDLSKDQVLKIKLNGFNEYEEKIMSYNNNKVIYLYPAQDVNIAIRQQRMVNEELMQMDAIPAVMEMNFQNVADEDKVIRFKAINKTPKANTKGVPHQGKKAEANKPQAAAINQKDAKRERNNHVGVNRNLNNIKNLNKEAAAAPNPIQTYYRARKFPVPSTPLNTNDIREDFRSTIYWKPDVKLNENGEFYFSFPTSAELTSFRIIAEGIAVNGQLGRGENTFSNMLPISVQARIPSFTVQDDVIEIPVQVKNSTSNLLHATLQLQLPYFMKSINEIPGSIELQANETKIIPLTCLVKAGEASGNIQISLNSPAGSDNWSGKIKTTPKGFPAQSTFSSNKLFDEFVFYTENMVDGSLNAKVSAFPSVVSDLLKGIESILNEPNGCFEQTSMTSYPNVMVRDYLDAVEIKDEKLRKRTDELLDKGYHKLITFETKENGYEWFGGAPGHEALTAYGLMQFYDMQKVYPGVSHQMIDRTANWLLASRDGEGGYKRNPRALDNFGRAEKDITDAYITWGLASAGFAPHINRELNHLYNEAVKSEDPYVMALACNALFANNKDKRAEKILDRLISYQQNDGSFKGNRHSITYSTHQSLQIETTSLTILAMLESLKYPQQMMKAVEFLIKSRQGGGGFGNTQSTILALKALTSYAKFSKKTSESGTIEVYANGTKAGEKSYLAGSRDVIEFTELGKYLKPGKNKIEVKYKNCKQALPFTIDARWATTLPQSQNECKVDIETEWQNTQTEVGKTIRMNVKITNKTKGGLPSTMAIIGIPSGLTVQPWQLKEISDKKLVDYYEIKDNRLFLYYRQMAPSEVKDIKLDLKAELKGQFESPAACAYLYYTNEFKNWQAIPKVSIN